MSADAASLPCPICLQSGIFDSVQLLRDRLIHVSTNKILCPVCQEEVSGLDKLTIHLFSHVKLLSSREAIKKNEFIETPYKPKPEIQVVTVHQKKSRASTAKNKTSTSTASAPVKFVKIYPKLPMMPVNTVPVLDTSHEPSARGAQTAARNVSTIKMEASLLQINTTCDICSLQFVDANILRMHRCLIHNIDDNSKQCVTRYQCHLCSKNFKMKGSLMVHLRVAHYGFQCDNGSPQLLQANVDEGAAANNLPADDKAKQFEKNDNKQWQCDVCRKCFTTKYFLKKHKRLHTGETPYACAQCNKTFTFQQSYHKHLLYHNDEKPHACSFCGRAFKELSTLHNHQRIHTGEKPFSCETCGKCFRQRVSYLVHRRIHTGVMPYKCTACEKSFRYKVSQRTHKCTAQPPGTVVRQSGELVEKLKRKHPDPAQNFPEQVSTLEQVCENINYHQISEANAELVRTGAKLSLEDTEADNFTIIAEAFCENKNIMRPRNNNDNTMTPGFTMESNISMNDKSVPSPSEILKNLCLSKEDDITRSGQESEEITPGDYCIYKEFNLFL